MMRWSVDESKFRFDRFKANNFECDDVRIYNVVAADTSTRLQQGK